jgi:hypothetical protein
MNKKVKEIKEYIESPFSARGGISYEDMQLIFDYIKQLETNRDEAIEYIKHSWWLRTDQTYDTSKDLQGWEVEELLSILERGLYE